ncbi:MAG: hypothetical protein HRU15_04105 [Planctomycetes bacterium]|nr:hypothetical protein [Planctomycetota bacterium]
MTDCLRVQELLYDDTEVFSQDDRAHLDSCADCRALQVSLFTMQGVMAEAKRCEVPDSLHAKFQTEIKNQCQAITFDFRYLAAAAAIVLAVFVWNDNAPNDHQQQPQTHIALQKTDTSKLNWQSLESLSSDMHKIQINVNQPHILKTYARKNKQKRKPISLNIRPAYKPQPLRF